MPVEGMSLAIVGVGFPNKRGPARAFELALCVPGEPIELRPEPKNPADQRAIAVYSCRGIQVGYLTAERAWLLTNMLAEGREIRSIFQGVASTGAWCRIAFDGDDPVLPASETKEVPRDWWPDDEWSD